MSWLIATPNERSLVTGENLPSIETVAINTLVHGIFGVKFAFFVRIDDFPPTIELFAGPYGFVSNAFGIYDLY